MKIFKPLARGAALGLAALAACSGDAPETAPPTIADTQVHRECKCVEQDECTMLELIEGRAETRSFQCTLHGDPADRATCTWENRFDADDPAVQDQPWHESRLQLRRARDGGWCWSEPPR